MADSPRVRWSFRLGAIALGVIIALAIAEVGLRLVAPQPTGPSALTLHPDVGVIPKPRHSGTVRLPGIYTYSFHHTDEGFRITPGSSPSDDVPEVLLLGDSFAYGMGVEDDETTASQLAGVLAGRGMDVRVTNAARIGAGPGYALRLLQTRGANWRPDVIVYLFYVNDYSNLQLSTYFDVADDRTLTPIPPRDRPRQLKARLSALPGAYTLQSHSHIAGLLRRVTVGALGDTGPGPSVFDLDTLHTPTPYAAPYRAWLADIYLEALRDEAEARGARFLAFYLPSAAEVAALRRSGEPSEDEAAFLNILHRLGVDGLAFTQPLAESDRPIATLYYPEIHWRPAGHVLAARAMGDPVQAALCVQDTSLAGCATAPPDVRQIVEMRAGSGSDEPARRSPAD